MYGLKMQKNENNISNIFAQNVNEYRKEDETADKQIEKLQNEVITEKEHRKEERFLWIFALIICFSLHNDVSIGFLILCLLFLFCVARFLGIEYALKWFKITLNRILGRKG